MPSRAQMFDGNPCDVCGGTRRYVKGHMCVTCQLERAKRRFEAKREERSKPPTAGEDVILRSRFARLAWFRSEDYINGSAPMHQVGPVEAGELAPLPLAPTRECADGQDSLVRLG